MIWLLLQSTAWPATVYRIVITLCLAAAVFTNVLTWLGDRQEVLAPVPVHSRYPLRPPRWQD